MWGEPPPSGGFPSQRFINLESVLMQLRHDAMLTNIIPHYKRRHNERYGVSNHQYHDCLLNRFFQAQIKENIKAQRHWPLRGEFTGDQWISRTNCHYRGKYFNLMTSSWLMLTVSIFQRRELRHAAPCVLGPRGRLSWNGRHCHITQSTGLRSDPKWAPDEDRTVPGLSRSSGLRRRGQQQLWYGPGTRYRHRTFTTRPGRIGRLAAPGLLLFYVPNPQTAGIVPSKGNPDSKVRGANMGPIWGWQGPGGPHVGPINFAIWEGKSWFSMTEWYCDGLFKEDCNELTVHQSDSSDICQVGLIYPLMIPGFSCIN